MSDLAASSMMGFEEFILGPARGRTWWLNPLLRATRRQRTRRGFRGLALYARLVLRDMILAFKRSTEQGGCDDDIQSAHAAARRRCARGVRCRISQHARDVGAGEPAA